MSFIPSKEKIADIAQRRLFRVDPSSKKTFPKVLQTHSVQWLSFGNDYLLALVFLSLDDLTRIEDYRRRNYVPFPGLYTTDPDSPSAFRFQGSRFIMLESNTVHNSISFSIGPDSTIVVVNHTHSVETKELGQVTYIVPLAYFVSFGDQITTDNVYDSLEELIAYSVNMWRKPHD